MENLQSLIAAYIEAAIPYAIGGVLALVAAVVLAYAHHWGKI